jgi:hypothetical protein
LGRETVHDKATDPGQAAKAIHHLSPVFVGHFVVGNEQSIAAV